MTDTINFDRDSGVVKASLDLATTASLFDPEGELVDHGAEILAMAKLAVSRAKTITGQQTHEYEFELVMPDGGMFVWHSKPLAELEAIVKTL